MDHAVDRRGGGHGILEDPVPLGEDKIAGDENGAPLVPFSEEGEEHLHLVALLLDVAYVVHYYGVEAIELSQLGFEDEVTLRPLGIEETLTFLGPKRTSMATPLLEMS